MWRAVDAIWWSVGGGLHLVAVAHHDGRARAKAHVGERREDHAQRQPVGGRLRLRSEAEQPRHHVAKQRQQSLDVIASEPARELVRAALAVGKRLGRQEPRREALRLLEPRPEPGAGRRLVLLGSRCLLFGVGFGGRLLQLEVELSGDWIGRGAGLSRHARRAALWRGRRRQPWRARHRRLLLELCKQANVLLLKLCDDANVLVFGWLARQRGFSLLGLRGGSRDLAVVIEQRRHILCVGAHDG